MLVALWVHIDTSGWKNVWNANRSFFLLRALSFNKQYQKAITALLSLDYEITGDNAKGLGKGKTKLPGIGKGSADKIHEFVTSGTIQKLEEKRLLHAA